MRARAGRFLIWPALALLLLAQAAFTHAMREVRPAIEAMPPPPAETALKGMAFGDDEFLYRATALWLQDVGDGGGRLKPLREMDYDRVVAWLRALDRLDPKAEFAHAVAAHEFGQVQIDPSRVRKIVLYLREVGLSDPARRWPWLVWAAERARHELKDKELVRGFAHDFAGITDRAVPAWVRGLATPLYHYAGDAAAAAEARAALLKSDPGYEDEAKAEIEQMRDLARQLKERQLVAPAPAGK